MLIGHSVLILLKEALRFIGDVQGVMGNGEGGGTEAWFLEDGRVGWLVKRLVKLLEERGVGA